MTPERLAIARRLVACPRWVFLPGMRVVDDDEHEYYASRVVMVEPMDGAAVTTIFPEPADHGDTCGSGGLPGGLVPDLDDDVTRAAVLVVVRRAWAGMLAGSPHFGSDPAVLRSRWEDCRVVEWQVAGDGGGMAVGCGPTEIEALCAALEAAP